MRLIGMLDSPYVRRVAISLQLLGLRFTHEPLSVFRNMPEMTAINPVIKVPTLVCDDGTVLMDSTLILHYAESLPGVPRSLMPNAAPERLHAWRTIGLALAACEKSVQFLYEHRLRPQEKAHAPWVQRVTDQLLAAYGALEADLTRHPLAATSDTIDQAGLSVAVAWHFTQHTYPDTAPAASFPRLHAFSAQAELLPAFIAAPHGEGTYRHGG